MTARPDEADRVAEWRRRHPAALRRHKTAELARLRAKTRLAGEYPDRYRELVAEETGRYGTPAR